jgi:hypothetical protein
MSNRANYVPYEEHPEKSIDNIPQKEIERAISSFTYLACANCDEKQWFFVKAGYNTTSECVSCGEDVLLIG